MARTKPNELLLSLGALGVVFGDIGTSPLYALQAVFGPFGERITVTAASVYGIVSLLIWSVILVVSIKYVGFIMRADNEGEGGVMALTGLLGKERIPHRYKKLFLGLGIVGIALFYGDSVITPAVSVLSAVGGVSVVAPRLDHVVVPLSLVILSLLFIVQRFGTGLIGRLFGPVMTLWFIAIGVAGGWRITQNPHALVALLPWTGIDFFIHHPLTAFIAFGAVVLAITGAEALYADMGHFGRTAIGRAWLVVVLPALLLCYVGQGARMTAHESAAASPFYALFPHVLQLPAIILATLATLIASQSVISGAFSLTRQAIGLNFLPKLSVRHTSDTAVGQIYVPFVNGLLFVAVILLVIGFGSAERLTGAYGIAVSGTLLIDSLLFLAVAKTQWQTSAVKIAWLSLLFVPLDLLLITANSRKLFHGGWIPLLIAAGVLSMIGTWRAGQRIINAERRTLEGTLPSFISSLRRRKPAVTRLPGSAIYIGHHKGYTPMALRASIEQLHELPEKVVIVYVETANVAHAPEAARASFSDLGYADGISTVTLTYGFHDSPNVPHTLQTVRNLSPELDFDPYKASYFVSQTSVRLTRRHNMNPLAKSLYALLSRNALNTSDYYRLPLEQTVEIRTPIPL